MKMSLYNIPNSRQNNTMFRYVSEFFRTFWYILMEALEFRYIRFPSKWKSSGCFNGNYTNFCSLQSVNPYVCKLVRPFYVLKYRGQVFYRQLLWISPSDKFWPFIQKQYEISFVVISKPIHLQVGQDFFLSFELYCRVFYWIGYYVATPLNLGSIPF